MVVDGQSHSPAALPQGNKEPRYPWHKIPGGPQGQSGHVQNISPSTGYDPRTVQPKASRYTD